MVHVGFSSYPTRTPHFVKGMSVLTYAIGQRNILRSPTEQGSMKWCASPSCYDWITEVMEAWCTTRWRRLFSQRLRAAGVSGAGGGSGGGSAVAAGGGSGGVLHVFFEFWWEFFEISFGSWKWRGRNFFQKIDISNWFERCLIGFLRGGGDSPI